MRFTTKLFLLSMVVALMAGMCGGLIGTLLMSKRQIPRIAVVDLQKLMRVQVASLRELQGSEQELEQAASQAAPKIKQAIHAWAKQNKTIILNKQQVLSPLPNITEGIAQLIEVKP